MKPNYVLFVVFSFLILFGWNYAVTKKLLPPSVFSRTAETEPPSSAASPDATPAAAGLSGAPLVVEERPVDLALGRHEISFNAHGAGIIQWSVREDDGNVVPLVLPYSEGRRPLTLFPSLTFRDSRPAEDEIAFEAERADGLRVKETYKINADKFLQVLTVKLSNAGKAPVDASYQLGWGPGIEAGGDAVDRQKGSRLDEPRGLALEGERLWNLKPGVQTGSYAWYGVDARYFLAAFLNDAKNPLALTTEKKGKLLSVHSAEKLTLAPGETKEFQQRFYLGPKGFDRLASFGLGLERAVNFGIFSTLGRWIYRCLLAIHKVIGNFGWAIILLTFGVQLLVSPLTVTSFKHSQKMKTLQPQMKRLQEMYKSDPQRLNQEMLALYQRHGLKFMGLEGCLPMVIQMPVFFSLYAVFSKTYELRHTPWLGWIKDLSIHDPYYVLPVLMGLAMFGQQKMTTATVDPSQKQLMYIMPVMFTFIFLKMPAGLVIYWLTNSLLTLALQLFLLKRYEMKQENSL